MLNVLLRSELSSCEPHYTISANAPLTDGECVLLKVRRLVEPCICVLVDLRIGVHRPLITTRGTIGHGCLAAGCLLYLFSPAKR